MVLIGGVGGALPIGGVGGTGVAGAAVPGGIGGTGVAGGTLPVGGVGGTGVAGGRCPVCTKLQEYCYFTTGVIMAVLLRIPSWGETTKTR